MAPVAAMFSGGGGNISDTQPAYLLWDDGYPVLWDDGFEILIS